MDTYRPPRVVAEPPTTAGAATRVLARMTVAPALLVIAWLVVALPLLLAKAFQLGPALALFVLSAAFFLILGFRGTSREAALGIAVGGKRVSWWVVAAVAGIALVFLLVELAMCSQQLAVMRDPATYMQYGTWLDDHPSLPISENLWAFGGADPSLSFASPGFYQQGTSIVPQFMAGLPLILALGGWIGGTGLMLALAPIMGAAAILSFGGLTARLVGPRWAPLGALTLALCLPMLWIARSTYSELPAMILLFGGLCLLHDVRELGPPRGDLPGWRQPVRVRAGLAGLAFGLIVLVRVDGIRDILPVLLFGGLLVARRRPTGWPLLAGLAAGSVAGLVEGVTYSRPYFHEISGSLRPLLLLAAGAAAGTLVLTVALLVPATGGALRRAGRWIGRGRVPDLVGLLPVVVMIGFALRPVFGADYRIPQRADDVVNAQYIKHLQIANSLPQQWGRQYTELSLYWVVWYIGVPCLLLATFGAALLVRRLVRLPGRADRASAEWVLPMSMIAWTTVTTLARPGITPDQPWATRRLISVVIPGLILLAVWALAWSFRRLRRLGYGSRAAGGAALLAALLVLVPIGVVSAPLAFQRTEHGELAASEGLCAKLAPGDTVLFVERVTADRFSQLMRSMCGLPAGRVALAAGDPNRADPAAVRRLMAKIVAVGRRPVLLGASADDVRPYGTPQLAYQVRARQDGHTLTRPAHATWRLSLTVYLADPSSSS